MEHRCFQVESISIVSTEPTCPCCLGPLMHLAFSCGTPASSSVSLTALFPFVSMSFPPIHFFFFLACMFSLRETSPVSSRFSSFLYILHEPSHPMCPEGSECKRTEQPWEHPVGSLACLACFCLDENALDFFLLCLFFFFNVPCLLSVLVHSVFKRACKYCTLLQNLLTRYPSLCLQHCKSSILLSNFVCVTTGCSSSLCVFIKVGSSRNFFF